MARTHCGEKNEDGSRMKRFQKPIYNLYDLSLIERIDIIRKKPQIRETRKKFISVAMRERVDRLRAQYLDVWANGIKRQKYPDPQEPKQEDIKTEERVEAPTQLEEQPIETLSTNNS